MPNHFCLGKPREGTPCVILDRNIDTNNNEDNANIVFMEEYFQTSNEEFSQAFFDFITWHYNREVDFEYLTDDDMKKAQSLFVYSDMIRKISKKLYPDEVISLLSLDQLSPSPYFLICPMIVKMPVISVKFCIELDVYFSINEIRKSKHIFSDEIIDYFYDLVMQYKIAMSLLKLNKNIESIKYQKKHAVAIVEELESAELVEILITRIKSSIEKAIVMLAYTYEIGNIENQKTHKSRLSKLNEKIPDSIKKQEYFQLFIKLVSSEMLDDLHSKRTGLLHKRGISSIQPHSFFMNNDSYKVFQNHFLHIKNEFERLSQIIIYTFAMMTDQFVKIDLPNISFQDIPCNKMAKVCLSSESIELGR